MSESSNIGTDDTVLIVRRRISAPVEVVFRSWTSVEHLRRWWLVNEGFEASVVEVDLRAGGRYRLGMKEKATGNEFVVGGTFSKISPPHSLEYTWKWENEGGDYARESTVRVDFRETAGGTEVVVQHSRLTGTEATGEHETGWKGCLDQLQSVIETIMEVIDLQTNNEREGAMSDSSMQDYDKQLGEAHKAVEEAKSNLLKLRRNRPREVVKNYPLTQLDGREVSLGELFGGHSDLMLVHNMGKSCPYCTLWADGFNGVTDHLENRTAYALVSNDDPSTAAEFAKSRGWRFKVLSGSNGEFTLDMGFADPKDRSPLPGVSTFHKEKDGTIVRVSMAPFGPGDDFCGIWHLFDLLEGGTGDWQPKYSYNG